MEWTKNKPTVPGWYWWRAHETYDPEICHIYQSQIDGGLCVDWTTDCYTNGQLLSSYDLGEWAGPILPPTTPHREGPTERSTEEAGG